jgi:ribosomal protein S21
MIEVKRKEGESPSALLMRFSRRMKRSGVLKEANKRRFYLRTKNKRKVRLSALHRNEKKTEYLRMKKLGVA